MKSLGNQRDKFIYRKFKKEDIRVNEDVMKSVYNATE